MKTLLIFFCFYITASAQQVMKVEWESKHGAPVAAIHETNPQFAKLLRIGVNNLSEPMIMQFAGFGGSKLGLDKKQAATLQKTISSYYLKIAKQIKAGNFPAIPSALEYCFTKNKPTQGFSTVYLPKSINEKTKSIVFLHGYGGSFSYYMHYLASVFPDHIIVCPAYGISMGNVPDEYLKECESAVEKQLKVKLKKPTLMGLSAGGYGGFKHYARNIDAYDRFICIASLPPRGMIKPLPSHAIVRLIAGGEEGYVKSKLLDARIKKLKLQNYKQVILPNQGHFFLLTDEIKTRTALKRMISD